MSGERNFGDIGDAEDAVEWHWISIAAACDRLLARLQKYHPKKTAPAPPSTDAVKEGRGSG
jgi:hypothetical protein